MPGSAGALRCASAAFISGPTTFVSSSCRRGTTPMSPRGSWPSTVSVSARIGNVTTGIRSCWAKPLSMPPAFGALVISPPAGYRSARPWASPSGPGLCGPWPTENPCRLDVNRLPLEGEGGWIELLRPVVDPRKRRGVRHPVVTVVAIAVCAALSGARGFNAIAEWAKDLSRDTLRRLGSRRWTPPSEPTLRRVLQKLDADSLDAQLGPWLLQHGALDGRAVSVDGKTLRRAHDADPKPPHLARTAPLG